MPLPVLYELSHHKRILSFSGQDAETFLQGQITGDVSSLNESNNLFAALCNPKGRVITLFHLYKLNKTFFMVLSSDMSETIIKRLKMFIFRSDVSIEDVSNHYQVFGTSKSQTEAIIGMKSVVKFIKYPTVDDLALLILPKEQLSTLQSTFDVHNNYHAWQKLLIEACLPDITLDTSELFIPQMLNLDLLEGISFQKGCYTGQEVIARLHYKGTVKRRLALYSTRNRKKAGEEIYRKDEPNSIGTILNCEVKNEQGYMGLMVIKTSYMGEEQLTLNTQEELTVQVPKNHLH